MKLQQVLGAITGPGLPAMSKNCHPLWLPTNLLQRHSRPSTVNDGMLWFADLDSDAIKGTAPIHFHGVHAGAPSCTYLPVTVQW